MQTLIKYIYLSLLVILFHGCKEINEQAKYMPPDWLAGKLYTQILTQQDLGSFARCLELTGYDTIIDVTGSYTVFAPTDNAFVGYFADHPEYGGSVETIPIDELRQLVKTHIIQNAWSREQLTMLNMDGWIDLDDPDNSKPSAYKKQTLLKKENTKYWHFYRNKQYTIVDSTESDSYKLVFTTSRKYIPVYFRELFDVYSLTADDYEYFFERTFNAGQIYYANALVGEEEIFAENGFIYLIDKVAQPLENAEHLLKKGSDAGEYKEFLDLINQFPDFASNMEETYNQADAKAGRAFDTLFNLSYPGLGFDIHDELTGPNTNNYRYTLEYQNGLLAPTDEAFQRFLDEVVTANSGYPHWNNFESVPRDIKKIIVNTHMTGEPLYPSTVSEGVENADGDLVRFEESHVVQKYFGSNSTFIGLNEVVIPRAFSSVTGPVYLRPGYSVFMYAMQMARILPAITNRAADFSFYPISDQTFSEDSSLIFSWSNAEHTSYSFKSYNRSAEAMIWWVSPNDLARRILNQVGVSAPMGTSSKEFISNLAGNYIIVDNQENTVSGAGGSYYGWEGDSAVDFHPAPLSEPADNGVTYEVGGWFMPSRGTMDGVLANYPHFLNLMIKAGMFDESTYDFNFLSEGEFYTLFVPSAVALQNYNTDTLTNEELIQFIKYHFVKGFHIFTDGKQFWSNYETLRIDENSNEFSIRYSSLNIRPGYDVIDILDSNDEIITRITEEDPDSNKIIVSDTDDESNSILDYITTAVLHEIDTVLLR